MKTLKKYLITLAVELLAVLLIVYTKGVFIQKDPGKIFHILCDGFFAVGVVAAGFGLLIFTSNEGVFDGLVYGVSSFLSMFKKNAQRKYATFYDYKESRTGQKVGFGFLLICGLIFLVIAMIMYLFYNRYS